MPKELELREACRRRGDLELIDEVVAWTKAGKGKQAFDRRMECATRLAEFFDPTSLVLIIRAIDKSRILER